MAALFFVLLIVAAWDVTKTAVKAQHADYQKWRAAPKRAKGTKGKQPVTGPGKAQPRHGAGYWGREVAHGFPVARTAWHTGWLAHRTASEHQRARREEARTSSLEQRASLLSALREHRQRQREAQEQIEVAIKTADQPPKGKKEVREAVAKVLPFPRRDPGAAAPLPSETVGKPQPGPYARPPDDGAAHLKAPMPDPRLNDTQRQRDADPRLRSACAACGHDGSADDPLAVHPDGYRVHESHTTDPDSGLYVPPGDWPTSVPHRRNGDAPSPAANGGNMSADTTYTSVLADAKAAHAQSDEDTATIQKRMDDAYDSADAMAAENVDPAVIDAQMAYADSLQDALKALSEAGEHAGNTAGQAERYHGGMQEAVDNAPGKVAERQFHEGA